MFSASQDAGWPFGLGSFSWGRKAVVFGCLLDSSTCGLVRVRKVVVESRVVVLSEVV